MADFPTTPWQDLGYWQKRKKDKWRLMLPPDCKSPLVDTHCHLNSLSDPVFSLSRAACLGVEGLCTIVDPTEEDRTFDMLEDWLKEAAFVSRQLLCWSAPAGMPEVGSSLSEEDWFAFRVRVSRNQDECVDSDGLASLRLPWVTIGVGCHPHNARLYNDEVEARIVTLAHDGRVSVLGEIGLDYHYDLSPREVQKSCFRRQIRLAKRLGLPIALHVREAHDDALAILEEEGFPEKGTLLHCCSLDPEALKPWVEAGCWIAYGGPLTFSNAEYARLGAKAVSLDRLLTETDSPYMTPVPLRGVECQPDFVGYTAHVLADLISEAQGIDPSEALEAFARNARVFFGRESA